MRKTPTITQAVFAIGDLDVLVRARLAADGELCDSDRAVLRRIDETKYLVAKSDIDRRRSHALEDLGDVPLRLIREERELEQEYAHVALKAA